MGRRRVNAQKTGQNRMVERRFRWVCVEKTGKYVSFTEEKRMVRRRVYV